MGSFVAVKAQGGLIQEATRHDTQEAAEQSCTRFYHRFDPETDDARVFKDNGDGTMHEVWSHPNEEGGSNG